MADLNESIYTAHEQAIAFIAETGGLPEITAASADLRTALDQTRAEIVEAVFASRFPLIQSDHFRVLSKGQSFSSGTRQAVREEGESGAKRASLLARLYSVESQLGTLITQLVEIRTDLKVSQIEM